MYFWFAEILFSECFSNMIVLFGDREESTVKSGSALPGVLVR